MEFGNREEARKTAVRIEGELNRYFETQNAGRIETSMLSDGRVVTYIEIATSDTGNAARHQAAVLERLAVMVAAYDAAGRADKVLQYGNTLNNLKEQVGSMLNEITRQVRQAEAPATQKQHAELVELRNLLEGAFRTIDKTKVRAKAF